MTKHATNEAFNEVFLQNLRSAVSESCYENWFKRLKLQIDGANKVLLLVPDRYVKNLIEFEYKYETAAAVKAALPEAAGTSLSIVVEERAPIEARIGDVLNVVMPAAAKSPENGASKGTARMQRVNGAHCPSGSLSPKFRLQSFVTGKCNRVARSAAEFVVESPAAVYNPLVICGGHGLGKTHLLQGIAQEFSERSPNTTVLYISCEEFTNAYVSALQNHSIDGFRARLRNCDVLLIDDVQFLASRKKTQEELLHTFDTLRNSHKQIIFSSDVPPQEVKGLDPKLVARFNSGLVAKLEVPDADMRNALLHEIAKARGSVLPQDVVELIATHVNKGIRELEGAVCKLIALSAAEDRKPDLELAIVALRDTGYLQSGPLALQDILGAVCRHFNVNPDEVRSEKRHASIVHARHVGMYLSRVLTSKSVSEIGRFYGNRDHATVLHAARKIMELSKQDPNVLEELRLLQQLLGRG